MQIITKCLCISLSSIMTLIFMFFPKIYIILLHPEKNIRALFTTSKSIRCHIGVTRHSNISHKTSSSISSAHGPSSIENDPPLHRSLKKSSSSQTSREILSVEKTDTSCSPIRDDVFDFFLPEQGHKQLNGYPNDIITTKSKNLEYQLVPTSPNQVKLKHNKIHIKEAFMNGNPPLHHSMKPARAVRHYPKAKRRSESQKPILCQDCMEIERRSVKIIPSQTPKRTQIFTVEKVPLKDEETSLRDRRKIAISEESLSECSISETSACKLKRITIQL